MITQVDALQENMPLSFKMDMKIILKYKNSPIIGKCQWNSNVYVWPWYRDSWDFLTGNTILYAKVGIATQLIFRQYFQGVLSQSASNLKTLLSCKISNQNSCRISHVNIYLYIICTDGSNEEAKKCCLSGFRKVVYIQWAIQKWH